MCVQNGIVLKNGSSREIKATGIHYINRKRQFQDHSEIGVNIPLQLWNIYMVIVVLCMILL